MAESRTGQAGFQKADFWFTTFSRWGRFQDAMKERITSHVCSSPPGSGSTIAGEQLFENDGKASLQPAEDRPSGVYWQAGKIPAASFPLKGFAGQCRLVERRATARAVRLDTACARLLIDEHGNPEGGAVVPRAPTERVQTDRVVSSFRALSRNRDVVTPHDYRMFVADGLLRSEMRKT